MTLNITILTPAVIYQSADFRLSDARTGAIVSDNSPKTISLICHDWFGFLTYTGLGSWKDRDMSDWATEWLTGRATLSFDGVASVLATQTTGLIEAVRLSTGRRMRHTLVLAGFVDGAPRLFVVSNLQDTRGGFRGSPDATLTITGADFPQGAKARVFVTGATPAVEDSDRRLLGRLAREDPENGTRLRQRIEAVNQRASDRDSTISPGCVVMSIRADGRGVQQVSGEGERPSGVPMLMHGVDLQKQMREALASVGIDLSRANVVQAASVASSPSTRAVRRPAPRCVVQVADPAGSGYTVSQITSPDFELESASTLSDEGHVAGNGWLPDRSAPWEPWIWCDGAFVMLAYRGIVSAVNARGDVAGTRQGGLPERAVVYAGDRLRELLPGGVEVEGFSATRSTATAISADGDVVGEVRSDVEEPGRPNTRPAAFFADGRVSVAVDVPAPWGSRAVDVNASGLVLVRTSVGPADPRSIIWDPVGGSWVYVGDPSANVFPLALTENGTALGQARSTTDQGIAMTCSRGGTWQRVGTADDFWPVDLNDGGDVVGYNRVDGLNRPWVRLRSEELIPLPFVRDHHTQPTAINNGGLILGSASADHGTHVLLWAPRL